MRNPPLPLLARGPYTLLAAAAVGELPAWARRELRLPAMTGADSLLVRPAGHAIVGTVRWVMGARALPARWLTTRANHSRRTCTKTNYRGEFGPVFDVKLPMIIAIALLG